MKVRIKDYYLPYIETKKRCLFPALHWQVYPIFGIVNKPRPYKNISEYGIIIFGLWITIIHEWE